MSLLFVVASFVAAFLFSSALYQLALVSAWRGSDTHWTERARRLYPIRVATMINPLLFAAVAGITMQLMRGDAANHWLPAALAAWLGAAASGYYVDRQIWPAVTFKTWAGQFALHWLLFRAGFWLMGAAFLMMPPRLGWQAWVITCALVILIVSLVMGLTVGILRWTHLIQPAPVQLAEIASRAAQRAGAKLRKTWVSPGAFANAFALLPMKDMLFAERLLHIMSPEELESICAHEAAHLTESKWTFCGRLMGVLALCPLILFVPVARQFGIRGVALLLVTTAVLVLFPRWLARRMEQRADAVAASHAIVPAVYARALEKLYEANLFPAVMPKRSRLPHPDLYDRMLAAGVTPAYERPRFPNRMSWTTLLLTFVFGLLVFVVDSARRPADATAKDVTIEESPGWPVFEQ